MSNRKVVNEKKAVVQETIVYVGPSIFGVIVQNTILKNGIPAALQAVIKEVPAYQGLLVPIKKLPTALKEISNKQGAMHILYESAKQYKPGKGA